MRTGPQQHGHDFGVEYAGMLGIKDRGFTIMEVLIVLAVTAVLFMSSAILITGRQSRTAFEQAIREVQSQIQKTINEVAIGYYPSFGTVNCSGSPTGPVFTPTTGGQQGIHHDCIFMGKAMQFGVLGTSDPEVFKTYVIAGLRVNPTTGTEASSPAAAFPKAVAPSTSEPSNPDISTTDALHSGLRVYAMAWGPTSSPTPAGVIAFSQSLADYSGGNLVSGSQRVQVAAVNDTTLGMSPQAAAEAINADWASSTFNPPDGVRICFTSGTSEQSGLITIGGQQRDLAVTLDIKSNTTCA